MDTAHRRVHSESANSKMISISKSKSSATNRMSSGACLALASLLLVCSRVCLAQTTNQLHNEQYLLMSSDQQPLQLDPSAEYVISNELLAAAAASEQSRHIHNDEQQHVASPGHYEFDVAPKMEPPTVRKPPYDETTQTCHGSDLLGGFSPRDTLCGDLNQGKVPLNPLGQSVNGKAYPFELIKNKTLQFLARALPVLKLEYETIPKVARYLPANHLLNPTHNQSPLGDGHFHELNQRFASSNGLSNPTGDLLFDPTSGLLTRRRRSVSSGKQHQASLTVAELASNASVVVVSSAHSQTGRIQAKRSSATNDSASPQHHMMITKDGFRQINPTPTSGGSQQQQSASSGHSHASPTPTSAAVSSVVVVVPNSTSRDHDQRKSATATASDQPTASLFVKSGANNQQQSDHGAAAGNNRQQTLSRGDNQVATGRNHANQVQTTAQGHRADTHLAASNRLASEPGETNENGRASGHLEARSSGGGGGSSSSTSMSNNGHQQENSSSSATGGGRQNGGKNSLTSSAATQRNRLNCAGLGSSIASTFAVSRRRESTEPLRVQLLTYLIRRSDNCFCTKYHPPNSVCQTAAALIEGDKPPAWIQVAKQIGNLYAAGSSSTDSLTSWPLLGLLGVGGGSMNGGHSDAAPADQTDAKSSSGAKQSPPSTSSASPTSSTWSVLTSLANLLTPSMQKDSSDHHQHTGVQAKRNDHQHKSSTSLTDQLSASTLTKMALAGWATTALAGLVEYFAPSAFSSASSAFSRRKQSFDPRETFVDTRASLAAMSAANLKSAPGSLPLGNSLSKQPPTPCPSVEEYISPTFARNYQGAWKYVVQIPHEGYFTQTIQRSSCVRQKCEFTDGVCHEAPRWVSLLVAEIYYPNAVFGSATQNSPTGQASGLDEQQPSSQALMAGQMQPSLMSSPSTSSLQQVALGHPASEQLYASQIKQQPLHRPKQLQSQDPLQMTDSFNTYNSAAFLNAAASQLGIDPSNVARMQQLADAHNNQLTQRNGQLTQYSLIGGNQPQVAESRASHTPVTLQHQPTSQARQFNQAVAPQQNNDISSSMSYNEYIRALADETLRQNPDLTVADLIKSLQLQSSRRKRNLNLNASEQARFIQQQQQFNQLQHRSSPTPAETSASLNDLGASLSANQKQSFNQAVQNDQAKQQMIAQQDATRQLQPNQDANSINANQETQQAAASSASSVQTECDGHDKIGCYVVRVYYDWFLVNGSCKCWKTSTNSNANQQQQQGSGNSFLRRIFTG